MRCFIAIDIDNELRDKIVDLQKRIYEDSLKLVEKENLHITLKFLGEISEDKSMDIARKLENIEYSKFETEFFGLGIFPNFDYIRVVWVDVKGPLEDLVKKINSQLPEFPVERFASHLTIARVKQKPINLRQRIFENRGVVIGKQLVDKFSLRKSTLTPKGPIYEDVKVFELA